MSSTQVTTQVTTMEVENPPSALEVMAQAADARATDKPAPTVRELMVRAAEARATGPTATKVAKAEAETKVAPETPEETKLADSTRLKIKIMDQSGEETYFKVKGTTSFGKIFHAYAHRKGVDAAALRFMLDGARVTQEQTPKLLDIQEGDAIDCFLEQTGGGYL